MSLKDRIVRNGQSNTNTRYMPHLPVYAPGTDHTSLGLGEPGAVNASGMVYPSKYGDVMYETERVTPLVRIGIYDGVLSYEDGPISDPGAGGPYVIPQTAPGEWAQLYRAGRLYGR